MQEPVDGDRAAMTVEIPAREDEGAPRRRRRLPPISMLPTLCTLGNLVAGFSATHYALRPPDFAGPWGWSGLTMAGVLVFLGMLLDAVDGAVARLVRSTSDIGAELDSLADMVTFGVAPASMMIVLVSRHLGESVMSPAIIGPEVDDDLAKVVWAVAVVYVCCTALRLARFNVQSGHAGIERSPSFQGLPSPGAAGCVASLIILHQHLFFGRWDEEVPAAFARGAAFGLPFVTLLCAIAMVSSIPYAHVTNRYFYGARSFPFVVRVVVLLAVAISFTQETLASLFTLYVLSGPFLLWRAKSRQEHAAHAE